MPFICIYIYFAVVGYNRVMEERTEKFYDVLKDSVENARLAFLETLNNPQELTVAEFSGLILYIYSRVFKPTQITSKKFSMTILDPNNAKDITIAWNLYTNLCCMYNKTNSIIQFSSFTGISYDYFYHIVSGRRKIVNQDIQQAVQKIYRDTESATFAQALDGNRIGAIFALKSKFGYTDSKPQEIIIHNGAQLTASEIQDKYLDLLPDNSTAQITDNSDTQKTPENMPEMVN